eukprot:6173264-Pleurochrysis_carterae.AAC.1
METHAQCCARTPQTQGRAACAGRLHALCQLRAHAPLGWQTAACARAPAPTSPSHERLSRPPNRPPSLPVRFGSPLAVCAVFHTAVWLQSSCARFSSVAML